MCVIGFIMETCLFALFSCLSCRMTFVVVYLLSHVQLFAMPRSVCLQAPLFMEFFRQEYWGRLPFPFPNPQTEPESPAWQVDSSPLSHQGSPLHIKIIYQQLPECLTQRSHWMNKCIKNEKIIYPRLLPIIDNFTVDGTTDWIQIGKGVCQGYILSPCYLTYT